MFRRSSSKSVITAALDSNGASVVTPITMTLNGMKFMFDSQMGTWKLEKNEFEKAADALNQVLDERDTLLLSLEDAMLQIQGLKKEIFEINQTNKVSLSMLMEEKQKSHILQQQVDGYRNELTDCCETIATLQIQNKQKLMDQSFN